LRVSAAEKNEIMLNCCSLCLGYIKARFGAGFCIWHSRAAADRRCEGRHCFRARHGLPVDWWSCMY